MRDSLNFFLTNRIPRRLATKAFARFSRIENRRLARLSIGLWQRFADLELHDSRQARFESLHACFTRELKSDARPVDRDPRILTSPCDAIVGAGGTIAGDALVQVKGSTYRLDELLASDARARSYIDGEFVTLRLTASMYHHFHAPYHCTVRRVAYIRGDAWNVNPPALARVPRLYCRNERAIVETVLEKGGSIVTLVPVGAILVASIRFRFLDRIELTDPGTTVIPCQASFAKGEAMGWFEHGSTIIVLAPKGFALLPSIRQGARIRMGEPLMRVPFDA
jgi:phosphatidylserine decarboxylase